MGDLTHLRPLRALDQEPVDVSLDFALMAATRHAERGEWQAMISALADVLWIQYEGKHEDVSAARMVTLIRGLVGFEWSPPSGGEAA